MVQVRKEQQPCYFELFAVFFCPGVSPMNVKRNCFNFLAKEMTFVNKLRINKELLRRIAKEPEKRVT